MRSSLAIAFLVGVFGSSLAKPTTIPIRFQVYRHGNSCSNIILDCVQRANCRTFDLDLHDAILTDFGQDASANLAGKLPKADIVMSSTLLRAMQTGLYSFPDVTVYPVPYLKEASLVAPSIPLPVADQKAVLLKVNGAEKAADVSFRYAGDADCEVEPTAPRCVADWNKFLKWLGNTLANYPPKELKAKLKSGKPIDIAIISHSIAIQDQIIKRNGAANNKGFSGEYTFNTTSNAIIQKANSTWKDIKAAPGVAPPCVLPRTLLPEDYAVCQEQYPEAWAGLLQCMNAV